MNGTGLPGVDANGNYYTNIATPNHTDEEARLFASQHLFDYNGSETQFQKNALGNNMAYNVPGAIYTPTGSGSNASATMSGAYLVDPVTGKSTRTQGCSTMVTQLTLCSKSFPSGI